MKPIDKSVSMDIDFVFKVFKKMRKGAQLNRVQPISPTAISCGIQN
jgi:hypothetical protein